MAVAALTLPLAVQAVDLQFTEVATTNDVVDIRNAGDGSGRLFLVQKPGRVSILKGGEVLFPPFLDISGPVRSSGGEQGLLSIAFAPDFGQSGLFYAWYTNSQGDMSLSRFGLSSDPDNASEGSEEILLTVPQPFSNHNGGRLAFGPDGMLYLSIGDGGGAGDPQGAGQGPGTLLGKIIRIDVSNGAGPYDIPPDNPFVADANTRDEIWALGLRNPWRISFDRQSGDLYIADVGQNSFEEINVQDAGFGGGVNYGWNIMEGDQCFQSNSCDQSTLTLPVAQYGHDLGCSVTGGEVYRGPDYPALNGVYVYGDFCSGRIWGLSRQGSQWNSELLDDSSLNILTFGQDERGNLYLSDGNAVYLLSDGPPVQAPLFQINEFLNDAWVRSGVPFQGLFITVFPVLKQVFVAWFTFETVPPGENTAAFGASDQRWVTALGSYSGNQATLQAELTTGGLFNSDLPLASQDAEYGTLELEFEHCNLATVSFDFPDAGLSGVFEISRALDSNVALCEAYAPD